MNMIRRILSKLRRTLTRKSKNYQAMANSLIDQNSVVGDYTYIGFNCIVTKAEIGRYCSIANNINIGPGEHALSDISTSSVFYENPYEKLTQKPVKIGHDVWIGSNCIIRRGVTVGNGAVIGANSFVNSDVPAFAIYAGTPAKLIRYRFDEPTRNSITQSAWWNYDLATAKKMTKSLQPLIADVKI